MGKAVEKKAVAKPATKAVEVKKPIEKTKAPVVPAKKAAIKKGNHRTIRSSCPSLIQTLFLPFQPAGHEPLHPSS